MNKTENLCRHAELVSASLGKNYFCTTGDCGIRRNDVERFLFYNHIHLYITDIAHFYSIESVYSDQKNIAF